MIGAGLVWTGFGWLEALAGRPARAAYAQSGEVITHTTVLDFSAGCAQVVGVSISDAGGGELRLAANVEDYFSGSAVDPGLWMTGTTYNWYTVPITVSGGLLTLDGNWLRSQENLQSVQPRFFEARARVRLDSRPPGWPDLGFYREHPPLVYGSGPWPATSALRLFVFPDTSLPFARGRDGDGSNPLIDINLPAVDLTVFRRYRIEWEAAETRFYFDDVQQAVMTGTNTLDTWVFLYHQTPSTFGGGHSPMQVDWVRAGDYAPSGLYQSCTLDAGAGRRWTMLQNLTDLPSGTTVSFETRTSHDGSNWSSWSAVSGQSIVSPDGRYLQYRLLLSTSNSLQSPEVQEIVLTNAPIPTPTSTPTSTPTPTATNTPTSTPTPTATATATPTATPTPTATATPTSSPTPSPTSTAMTGSAGENRLYLPLISR